jgi:RNA polymerase sigma-70 factor (ECF subfamily)
MDMGMDLKVKEPAIKPRINTESEIMQKETTLSAIYERQVNTIYRICFSYLRNISDAEDATAETFLKLMNNNKIFKDSEHEKAFLIRVAINICKNYLKNPNRKSEDIEDYPDIPQENSDVSRAIAELPEKYRTVIYLFYYEGYTGKEISKILKTPHSTIRNHLSEARTILKDML